MTETPETKAATTEPTVHKIPESNMAGLRARVEKLNKRAAKLGCPPISIVEVGREVLRYKEHRFSDIDGLVESDQAAAERIIPLVLVTMTGEAPKLNGWTFLGTIQHLGEEGNILRLVPEETVPEAYRKATNNCDQCRTARPRIDTFIVRHDDGRHAQVGRQCLKDFLGHEDPEHAASMAGLFCDARDLMGEAADPDWGGGGGNSFDFEDRLMFMTRVAQAVRLYGWVSKAMARDQDKTPTAAEASSLLHPPKNQPRPPEPTEADGKMAEAAIAWVQALEADRGPNANDYEWNLITAFKNEDGLLHRRCLGIAASAVSGYGRAKEIEMRRSHAAQTSKHFGTVKVRADFTLTVVSVRFIAGDYGTTAIHSLVDADGNQATWFSSSETLEVGKTYLLKGTVKAHQVYQGVAQTVITRCKVLTEAA